jgi:hypothetical protein
MQRNALARDILIVVAVKFALAIAAAMFLFGPHQRPRIDASGIATRLMDVPSIGRQSGN